MHGADHVISLSLLSSGLAALAGVPVRVLRIEVACQDRGFARQVLNFAEVLYTVFAAFHVRQVLAHYEELKPARSSDSTDDSIPVSVLRVAGYGELAVQDHDYCPGRVVRLRAPAEEIHVAA